MDAAPDAAPVDRTLFRTDLVAVGAFRCDVDHPVFRDSGPIRQPCFVFPRTTVVIEHESGPGFVADPTLVTLYNAGQAYTRHPVSPDGDRCDWYGVAPDVLRDAIRSVDPDAADMADDSRVIRRAFALSRPELYLRQRRLFTALQKARAIDPLIVEETVCSLLRDVLLSAYRDVPPTGAPAGAARARFEVVAAAKQVLARRFRESMNLSEIAAAVGCSPFHLSRRFHEATGLTLHHYRAQLRLRAALELIEARTPLTEVALEVGYSSHSHFTEAFREAYGVPPSTFTADLFRQQAVS